jgi:hypothetical protein
MDLDDPRWPRLEGAYRVPIDVRPFLRAADGPSPPTQAWLDLWQELYHQGMVGEASYASVPVLVAAEVRRPAAEWNAYALVAAIELARDGRSENPRVPPWIEAAYSAAIEQLARHGLTVIVEVTDEVALRSILGLVAMWKGARAHARLLIEFDSSEVAELERQALGDS